MTPEETAKELFRRFAAKDTPDTIAEVFSEQVDWYIAGDTDVVPWIGRKTGRAGVADFWEQIQAQLQDRHWEFSDFLTKGNRVVVLGHLESELRTSGRVICTEFVFDLDVEDGQITRFRMLEDTHAVAQAFAERTAAPKQMSVN